MSATLAAPPAKWQLWLGRVLSALPVLAFVFSASMKLRHDPKVVEAFVGHLGLQESTVLPIGLLEITCAAVYLVPQTSVLGAVLLTGYLGGTVLAHLRVGDPFVAQVLFGVLLWAGLWLRDPRIRALLPLRRPADG